MGTLSFPITLTSGYHNTVTLDRINDTEGYIPSNVEIRPHFLNSPIALQPKDLKTIVQTRVQPRTEKEIQAVVLQLIDATTVTMGKFYKMANSAKASMCGRTICGRRRKSRGLFYLGGKQLTYAWHLATVFMQLGARCAYTGAPAFLGLNKGPLMVSLERVNSDGNYDYNENQTTLIVVGLNCVWVGQKHSELSVQQRAQALRDGSFNQEYWNKSTNVTAEVQKAIDQAREADRIRLQSLFKVDKKMLQRIAKAKTASEQSQ